jgi:hypothetical protein
MRLKRACHSAANVLGAAAVVVLLLDPTRPLLPVIALPGAAVVLMFLSALPPPRE